MPARSLAHVIAALLAALLLVAAPLLQAQTEVPRPYVYYFDLDQDGYGSQEFWVTSADPYPPNRLFIPWGNDANDYDPYVFPLPVPRGARLIGLDFGEPAEDGTWRPDLARELGAAVAPLPLLWNLIETGFGRYDGPQIAAMVIADRDYPREGFALSLSVNPIVGRYLALPPDLAARIEAGTLRFNDRETVERFKILLNVVRAYLPRVQLASLQIGHDVDQYMWIRSDPAFWAEYAAFFREVSAHARTLWGAGLKTSATATQPGLVADGSRWLLRDLAAAADFLSMSYRPRSDGAEARHPWDVKGDIERVLDLYPGKPLYIQPLGFASGADAGSSEMKQSQYIRAFFDVWDRYAAQIPLVQFERLFDPGALADPLSASRGLRTRAGAGPAKAAFGSLRNLAFERGWWQLPPRNNRSFHMGFTVAPFDQPPDRAGQENVAAYLDEKIRQDSDVIAIHMDGGVPWTEALADDFSSDWPPYSQAVTDSFLSNRTRIPRGHKVVVSINPLGVPRNQLAPYWGVGEGFAYSADFKRIGNGIIADDERRLLPAPWTDYEFDAPEVKQAFVNYARRVQQFFRPDYLCIAIEISATLEEDPVRFAKAADLVRHTYTTLKSRPEFAGTKIFISFSATSFMGDEYAHLVTNPEVENGVAWKYEDQKPGVQARLRQGFIDLLPYTDLVGFSLYPHYGRFRSYTMPAVMYDGLTSLLTHPAAAGKPIAISEAGFPADPFTVFGALFAADAQKQERFYRLMFHEIEKLANPVEFVVNFAVRDLDLLLARLAAGGGDPIFTEFYKYFQHIGIYAGDGAERAATAFWRQHFALPLQPKAAPQ